MKLKIPLNEYNRDFKLGFKHNGNFNVKFKKTELFKADFNNFQIIYRDGKEYPIYAGNYFVTPSTESTTLKTADKVMERNVVVSEIPYFEVTNLANGITATIA